MTEFEIKRLTKRVADLEKGYKDLSTVYGRQKLISFETVSKSIAAFEHTKNGMQALQETIEGIEDVMRQTAKAIDSLAKGQAHLSGMVIKCVERIDELEQKNTCKDHP